MLIAVVFREKTVEVTVGKKGRHPVVKKSITLDLSEKLYKNGEIFDPHALGKELLIQLKREKVVPSEIIFAVRSNDIAITEASIPVVEKRYFQQTIKVVLEEKYPGLAEKNYVAYQILGMEEDSFVAVVAMAPKAMIESYYALAKVMKCRLRKIDLYSSCVANAVSMVTDKKNERNQIFIDADGDFLQIYYMLDGAVLMSNSLMLQQSLSQEYNNKRYALLDKISQSIQAILSVIEEDEINKIYINNVNSLSQDDMEYLENKMKEQGQQLHSWRDVDKVDTLFAKSMLWNPKTFGARMNFALELNIDDTRNYSPVDAFMAVIAGLSIAAVATMLGISGYLYWQTMQMNQQIAEDELFIRNNQEVSDLYQEQVRLSEKSDYFQLLDHYLRKLQYDYLGIYSLVQFALQTGGSAESSIGIGSDMYLSVNASAASLDDIASVLGELKNQGFEEVVLQSVSPILGNAEGLLNTRYDYSVRFRYHIMPDLNEIGDKETNTEEEDGVQS